MSSLTIRNLELETKDELRRRAASHGRSMQEEAKQILRDALGAFLPIDGRSLYQYIRSLVEPIGGVDDLILEPREPAREAPRFE